MPKYNYRCQGNCGVIEIEHSMMAPSSTNCPHCNSAVQRLISLGGIQFKGDGFYINSAKSSSKKAGSSD